MPAMTAMRLGLGVVVALTFAAAIWETTSFPEQAALFPYFIGALGLILAVLTVVIDTLRWRREGSALGSDAPSTASTASYEPGASVGYAFVRAGRYLLWMGGYLLLMFLIGVVAAAAVFVTAFLIVEAQVRLRYVWLAPVIVVGLMLTLANAVNLFWPRALFPVIE